MGNPNEPNDPGQHPTENFAHPSDGGNQPPPLPPTQQYAAPGASEAAPGTPGRARARMTGTRRTIVLTGIAGLVVGGVAGGLIGWASTGDSTTSTTTTAQSAPAKAQTHKQQGKAAAGDRRHRAGTIGTITAVNGTSWTVAARDGQSVTVQIGTDTKFGTVKQPQQQSDFVVGDRVVVLGKENSGTVDATRVAKRAAKPATSTAPSSAAPGATTQPS